MSKKLCCGLVALMLSTAVWAADPELCLDCHEPAEDWEGMSAEEIVAQAKDAGIKRHADNQDISDEEMKKIVDTLLAE
jgi:hypothetical protein